MFPQPIALFQTSVLKKYLKVQAQVQISKAFKKLSNYFLNPEIQENIKSSKEEYFEDKKKKAIKLQRQINQLEPQIDQMVYELYGLTEEEISIVENT